MRRARAETKQAEAATTVVDKQLDDLLTSIAEREPAKPASKPRPRRTNKDHQGRRRVVITGIGAVTPLGLTVDEYWHGLIEGRSGIDSITLCDVTGLSCTIAGEVKGFEPRDYMDHKQARRMGRFSQFGIAASRMAIAASGINLDREESERMGVLIGNGIGGFPEAEVGCRKLIAQGGMKMTPLFMPIILPNMAAGQISLTFGLKGFTSTISTACAAATQAIGEAVEVIRHNKADVMVAGGTEAGITPTGVAGFCVMRALSSRNDEPTRASRPFDAQRDGFIPSEGAGILLLESLDHARRRDAPILAEMAGVGISSDAYHVTAPDADGAGAIRAMRWALEDAKVKPNEVDYINAHGTSTRLNDAVESLAIRTLFGDYAYKLPISSTKSMLGHLMGASGAVEAVACVKTINEGVIHPTVNYEHIDPDCDLDYVPNEARRKDVKVILSNSFGFGGQNACLVFKSFEG
ncbi:MAG: beta-ketoacyl-ACP synthase II [Dehalococcoidia bacterium]